MGVSNNDINDQNISIGPISNNNNMNITHLSSEDSNDCQNDQIISKFIIVYYRVLSM
ncbi:5529_t:CDS:2 [Entrophospora sp. SA101]|nr:5529_t:CDS:2 [Entrophospora sp. SA101]